MIYYLDPFSIVLVNGKAFKAEKVNGSVFGGFCRCGGIMLQRAWVGDRLMISECEKCWRVEAFLFNGRKLVERRDVEVFYRQNIGDFLKTVLSKSEFEALLMKARNRKFNERDFIRAKRKLEEIKIDVGEVLKMLS